jgi:hypothetical protein
VNRGQLKTRVARVLGVSLGTSDDEVDDTALLEELANEAVYDILVRTRVNIRSGQVTFTAAEDGATEFDIGIPVLRMHGIQRNGQALVEQARSNLAPNGFIFAGFSRIVLGFPISPGETLLFWYTPEPTPMTADVHDPSEEVYGRIPPLFHRAILDYMCWNAADKLGDMQAGRGERYRALYEGQDGAAGPGTDLGRIRYAVTSRGGNVIARRARESLVGDSGRNYWIG